MDFEYGMLFNIHIRDRWMNVPEDDLVNHAIEIEHDLSDKDINY